MTIPFITTKYLFRKVKAVLSQEKKAAKSEMKTALDAPSGPGALTQFLTEDLGFQVTAIDIDAAKWQYPGAKFLQADLSQPLPFSDNTFDLVVCMEGLKHFTNISSAMSEFTRVLKGSGVMLLTIPNDLCMQSRLRYFFDGFVDTDWIHPMSPDHAAEKEGVHLNSLISLPYLYYFISKNGLRITGTYTCHLRFWSLLLAIAFYPMIFILTLKAIPRGHPLRRLMLSWTWLAGRRNIIVCVKK